MTFTTKNTANQIYLWALSRAIRAGLYTLANTASSDSDVATGKLVKAGTFAANDVLRWGAEAMVTANLYTKDDVFVAYLQVKNTASLDNETKTTTFVNAMRDASQTEGKLARYGTEAFVGHMQMSHTTAGAKITAQCDKFDAVFTDLGEFLKNSENFNLSDMGYLAEMAEDTLLSKVNGPTQPPLVIPLASLSPLLNRSLPLSLLTVASRLLLLRSLLPRSLLTTSCKRLKKRRLPPLTSVMKALTTTSVTPPKPGNLSTGARPRLLPSSNLLVRRLIVQSSTRTT